jgi:protein-disulfide isomerase
VLIVVRPFRVAALIFCVAVPGCHAQAAAPANFQTAPTAAPTVQLGVSLTPEEARRVEVMVRSRSQVPPDYVIAIGKPAPSEFPGYDQIAVTFNSSTNATKPVTLLISTDGKTLGLFNRWDLSQDPRDKVSAAGRPARGGPEDAPVLIVGFDDLECPFCAKMNALLFPAILDRYKSQVRVVYRDLPLEELHPWAMHAAVDANCLAASSATGYWDFVDYVHAHAAEMGGTDKTAAAADKNLDQIALDEGGRQKLDQPALAACVLKQDSSKVEASAREAEAIPLSVGSTPVLFINGEKVEGVQPMDVLYRIIDDALIAAGQTPPPPPATPTAAMPTTATPPAATKPGS